MSKEETKPYIKKRRSFGRQPMFSIIPAHLIDSINPDPTLQRLFILRNPVQKEVQVSTPQSLHEAETTRILLKTTGTNHEEGGWPKDVNHLDEEATLRYRRRNERDDAYVDSVLNLAPRLEYFLKQNNSIELYEMFFNQMSAQKPVETNYITLKNDYRERDHRPVANISWSLDDDSKLIITYCDKQYFVRGVNKDVTCFIWNIENSCDPSDTLYPPSACWRLVCATGHNGILIGGLEDGMVCIFDIRESNKPVRISPAHLAHRWPVNSLVFLDTRLSNEFMSGATDGRCMWWDWRNLKGPSEVMNMDVNLPTPPKIADLSDTEPISSLSFDKAFPTRFLCGTDTGLIVNVNRKGKTHYERMSSVIQAHHGTVRTVQRNPYLTKCILSCGGHRACLWNDELVNSPLFIGKERCSRINAAAWAPNRVSSYITICSDGYLRYWDILRRHDKESVSVFISNHELLELSPNPKGDLAAIGNCNGSVRLLQFSENLAITDESDKNLLTGFFERDSFRERQLENRVKEIRLKQRVLEPPPKKDEPDTDALVKASEIEYFSAVARELKEF